MPTRPPAPPAPPAQEPGKSPSPPSGPARETSIPLRRGWRSEGLGRDLLVGVALGGLLAVSAFTPNEWLPSLAVGAAAAIAYVGWRLVQRRRSPIATGREAAAPAAGPLLRAPASVWVALVVVAGALTPSAVRLYQTWTASVWNNAHGILIPPMMGYMAWSVLRRDADPSERSSPWGFAFIVPGLLLMVLDAVLRTRQLAGLGLVLVLPGLSLLLLGAERTSRLRVPLLLSLLMVPVPITLAGHFYLKQTTAAAVAPLLSALGIPVLREQMVLHLPRTSFLIADACSGFGALYAAVGLSVVLAATARSHWRKLVLLAAAPCLALACNVVRVAVLVGMAHFLGLGILDTRFHEASGVATFGAVLVLLFLIADRRSLRAFYS